MCGQTLLCKAQIEAIIWKVMEEGRGCHTTGYQEGGYAHKPAKRAPAPLFGFTLLMAEQQRRRS